jgi:hypothetical protein
MTFVLEGKSEIMGDLRNRLERRTTRPWLGYSGWQIAALLWMWFHSKGRVDCPVPGEPPWWQSARAMVRKEVIHRISYRRKTMDLRLKGLSDHDAYQGHGYALTTKGWELCQRILTAFPRQAAEAEAEATRYFRMFEGDRHENQDSQVKAAG